MSLINAATSGAVKFFSGLNTISHNSVVLLALAAGVGALAHHHFKALTTVVKDAEDKVIPPTQWIKRITSERETQITGYARLAAPIALILTAAFFIYKGQSWVLPEALKSRVACLNVSWL